MLVHPGAYTGRGALDASAGGGGGALTWVDGQNGVVVNNSYSAGTKSVTNQNGGATLPACLFFVGWLNQDGLDPVALKIGTVSMSKAIAESASQLSLWYAVLSAGETDTVSFTNGAFLAKYGIVSGWITGSINSTPISPQTATYAASGNPVGLGSACAVPTGGFGVCVGGTYNITAANNVATWANNVGSQITASLASVGRLELVHTDASGNWSPTRSGASFATGLAACAFGP